MIELKIDCELETDNIVRFISDNFMNKDFQNAVIGISGGIDSAVVGLLLNRALGKGNVYAYSLPCNNSTEDFEIAENFMRSNFSNVNTINLYPVFEEFLDVLTGELDKVRMGNIMARLRMITLYDQSSKHNALVVGTGNKTELELGYFTMYGDGACAMEPIGHLYKTQVKQLAEYLGVPDEIISKPPSAGLWEGQTDEEELGASYEEIDKILSYMYTDVTGRIEGSYVKEEDINKNLFNIVNKRISKNRFKSELPKLPRGCDACF